MTDSTGFPRIPRSSLLNGRAQASVTRVTSQSSVSAHATCGDTPTPISHAWTRQPVNHCRDTPTLISQQQIPPSVTRAGTRPLTNHHRYAHTHPPPVSHTHITRRRPHACPPLPRHCPLTISPGPASRRTRMRGMGGNRRASTDFLQGKQREPNKSA